MSIIHRGLLVGILCAMWLGGCAHESRQYKPNPPDPNIQPLPLKVAVVEFEDRNPPSKQGGGIAGLFVPGWLYEFKAELYHPTRFGQCVARELQSSDHFATVKYFPSYDELASSYKEYDLLITGVLRHDRFTVDELYYGAMLLAASLWNMLGLPQYSVERAALFEIQVRNPRQPLEVKFSRSVSFDSSEHWGSGIGTYLWSWDTDARILWDSWSHEERTFGAPYSYYSPDLPYSDFCPTSVLRSPFLELKNALTATAASSASLSSSGQVGQDTLITEGDRQ